MKSDLKYDPEYFDSKIFIVVLFSCQINLVYRAKGFFSPSVTLLKISPGCFTFCLTIFMPYHSLKFKIPLEPIMFPFMSAYPDFFI